MRNKPSTRSLPQEERELAQVGLVFDLLVATDSRYGCVTKDNGGDWGWAQKLQE